MTEIYKQCKEVLGGAAHWDRENSRFECLAVSCPNLVYGHSNGHTSYCSSDGIISSTQDPNFQQELETRQRNPLVNDSEFERILRQRGEH
jgi:hypothetical protein